MQGSQKTPCFYDDSATIDLIYLDPPFNSNRTYETPIGSAAAGAAFKDAWHGELAERDPALYAVISAAEFTHGLSMKAYLIMMDIRMLEMRRVLKPRLNFTLYGEYNPLGFVELAFGGWAEILRLGKEPLEGEKLRFGLRTHCNIKKEFKWVNLSMLIEYLPHLNFKSYRLNVSPEVELKIKIPREKEPFSFSWAKSIQPIFWHLHLSE